MEQTRLSYLDSLRGLAAAVVVLVHYFAAFRPYSVFGTRDGSLPESTWETFCHIPPLSLLLSGHTAVCLFFILSGYVLSLSHLQRDRDPAQLLAAAVKRPFRLGGVVLFTIVASALLWRNDGYFNHKAAELSGSEAWLGGFWTESISSRSVLSDICSGIFENGVIYNPPLWTIQVELYGSLLVYLFLYLFGTHPRRFSILVGLVVASQSTNYLGFVLGMMAAVAETERRKKDARNVSSYFAPICLIAGLLLACYPCYASPEFRSTTIWKYLPEVRRFLGGYPMLAAALLFCGFSASKRAQETLNYPVLSFLGRISFGLYAVHCVTLGSVSSWMFVKLGGNGSESTFWIVLVAGLIINCVAATAVTILVEQPSVQFSAYMGRNIVRFLHQRQQRRQLSPVSVKAVPQQRENQIAA